MQITYIQVGSKVKIPAPYTVRGRGVSAQNLEATVTHIYERGSYATVKYANGITTSIKLRPVTRTNKNGKSFRAWMLVAGERTGKIGGNLTVHMPTPFGQDMVSAAARR